MGELDAYLLALEFCAANQLVIKRGSSRFTMSRLLRSLINSFVISAAIVLMAFVHLFASSRSTFA